jgi:hypothetical protein
MGPLFSLGLLALLGTIVIATGYVIGRARGYGVGAALGMSVSFCVGGAIGAATVALLSVAVLGWDATLENTLSVALYLASLGGGALVGGMAAARFITMRSNNSMERTRER